MTRLSEISKFTHPLYLHNPEALETRTQEAACSIISMEIVWIRSLDWCKQRIRE